MSADVSPPASSDGLGLSRRVALGLGRRLELLVTVYLLFTPAALVSQLLWVAPFVSAFVTLFFYGFFILGTKILLDPFSSAVGAEEGGFDTSSFFEDTVEIVEGINSRVGLHACALPNPVQTRQAAAGHVSEGWMCRCAVRRGSMEESTQGRMVRSASVPPIFGPIKLGLGAAVAAAAEAEEQQRRSAPAEVIRKRRATTGTGVGRTSSAG